MSNDLRKNENQVNDQKKTRKVAREDKLAAALKKNIKLRKENKNNC